jgi:hypothetical protein
MYVELQWDENLSVRALKVIAASIVLWPIAALLLVKRVWWARGLVRAIAAIFVAGTLHTLFTLGGSWLFYCVMVLRALIYAALFWSLRAPASATLGRERAT